MQLIVQHHILIMNIIMTIKAIARVKIEVMYTKKIAFFNLRVEIHGTNEQYEPQNAKKWTELQKVHYVYYTKPTA